MTYEEALEYIHGARKHGWKLGLKNITTLLELMGNPHRKLKYVHVAGTNGKGSTVSFISSILTESGYKVGVYTSPYLERFTERIRIGNEEIPEEDLARITAFVKKNVEEMVNRGENHPTEFEIITAIAFQYYYEQNCDIVVLEVGMGGRFDATNVIDTPLVSVITTINYDHMQYLGDTLIKIAFEKAGIIKNNGDVVLYPQPDEVTEVFEKACAERGSRLHKVDFDDLQLLSFNIYGQSFNYKGYKELSISLLGVHQPRNAVIAVRACELLREKGYDITEESIRRGLKEAKWPGRLEVLRKEPVFIIDAAHNPEGAKMLSESLSMYFPGKKIIFIMGVVKDKDYRAMVEAVLPIAGRFITVAAKSERTLPAQELANIIGSYCKNVLVSDTIESAVRTSLDLAHPDDVVCAFGSLFYIGHVRSFLTRNS